MFQTRLSAVQAAVEVALEQALGRLPPGDLRDAMAYAARGGKRLRAFLVLESAAVHGIGTAEALPAALAIELLHAYSLVHDDLPCMDNDDLRRGQPTVHRKWDEATAVLAGDALQSLAFELCCDPVLGPAERRVALSLALARAAGAAGMVYGQALDIAAETAAAPLTLDEITRLQAGKTGALIAFAAEAGAILAGAERTRLAHYAAALGLAFQIADDILDVEGSEMAAGKRLGKDAQAGKATFVSLMGLAAAKLRAAELVAEAETALEPYGAFAQNLRDAARYVIARDK